MATIYSSLKFLRFGEKLQALTEHKVTAPIHIRVKPTNYCNHNCWYCAYRNDSLALGEDMSMLESFPADRMLNLAREFVEMGVKAVTFSGGGEPLLYKSLPEVIKVLAAGNIRVSALTNGSNLKGRVADAFAMHGTWVRISMDAWDDESYVRSRGARPHDFSKLLDNIRVFAAKKSKCALGVSFIVGKENHEHIEAVCRQLKSCGVGHVKVSGVVVSNNAEGNNAYHNEIKAEVARQIEKSCLLADENFAVLNHYHDLEGRFEKRYHTCPSLQFLTVVGADQCVYTCQDKAYTESGRMASIADRSFKEFWFSQENQTLINSFDPSLNCQHHCVSHSKNIVMHDYISLDPEHAYFV
jgi:MoaA/NifB/PqqE/SkfB family radical SAM enzyme